MTKSLLVLALAALAGCATPPPQHSGPVCPIIPDEQVMKMNDQQLEAAEDRYLWLMDDPHSPKLTPDQQKQCFAEWWRLDQLVYRRRAGIHDIPDKLKAPK